MSERDYLIAKAKDWKNISQYQDERQQGRATARNGKVVAGAGGTIIAGAQMASNYSPDTFGTLEGAYQNVKGFKNWRKVRVAGLRETPDTHLKGAKAAFRSDQIKRVGQLVRSNPAATAAAAGVGAMGVGSAMWAGGRIKARNAEHNIARLRRERANKYKG